jgi:hypothetical protein
MAKIKHRENQKTKFVLPIMDKNGAKWREE